MHGSSALGMAGTLDVLSPCDVQQPEIPKPETRDAGQMGTEKKTEVMESETTPDSDEMKEACVDHPLPKVYIRVALAVEEDGAAVLIISPPAIESRAERESDESTSHSPAEPSALTTLPGRADDEHCSALYGGPVWIEEMELLRDKAHPPETSFGVTIIGVHNLPGNPLWQSKSTARCFTVQVSAAGEEGPRSADR
eukprot:3889459-Pleurochrysis_carterae.AAC.1